MTAGDGLPMIGVDSQAAVDLRNRLDRMVCGCDRGGHESWCQLGGAETIAKDASERARAQGSHRLVAALTALAEAGLLHDIEGDDEDQELAGVLDRLWDAELLGPREAAKGGGPT